MNRTIATKRLYWLGDFRNIEFYDQINDIPDEVLTDPSLMERLRYIMLLDIEIAFNKYKQLGIVQQGFEKLEETEEYLQTERNLTYEQFLTKAYPNIKGE